MLLPSPVQKVELDAARRAGVEVFVKRDDLIDRELQGNKWRKLKYNLQEARRLQKRRLLTFGGAYSNHLYSVAAAGKRFRFETVGIVRGEESKTPSPTIEFVRKLGMQLVFLDRTTYRKRKQAGFLEKIAGEYPGAYIIPEGGSNPLGVKGASEIVTETSAQTEDVHAFIWCVPVGSGGTMAGIINALKGKAQVLGWGALKGERLEELVGGFLEEDYPNWSVFRDDYFGGFAKWSPKLVSFINEFYEQTRIPLDPVYNGKMWFRILQLLNQGHFPQGSRLMVVHTGGLQGVEGFRQRFNVALLPSWKMQD